MKKCFLGVVLSGMLLAVVGGISGCGGSSGSSATTSNTKSFSQSSAAITIDNIVNTPASTASLSSADKQVSTATTAAFYFGRFFYFDGSNLFSGAVKFKLNKQSDTQAYFSDFTLEHYSQIMNFTTHNDIVTASANLQVPAAFDAATNHVEISNATDRFVDFDLDFGNNGYFGDIQNAGVVFSSDFTTMAGGNTSSFFFIAQKVDSQPDLTLSAIAGAWHITNFQVRSGSGDITPKGDSTVNVSGTGGNGYTAFTGTNAAGKAFNGELTLTDATSGSFFFGYGSGNGTPTATHIDGCFLVSADQSLAMGYDLTSGLYFAAER